MMSFKIETAFCYKIYSYEITTRMKHSHEQKRESIRLEILGGNTGEGYSRGTLDELNSWKKYFFFTVRIQTPDFHWITSG